MGKWVRCSSSYYTTIPSRKIGMRNPIMEGFRKWPQGSGFTGRGLAPSARRCCPCLLKKGSDNFTFTMGHSEHGDGIDSMSSGSMSPDRGDMWRQGYPESPQWKVNWNWGPTKMMIETLQAIVMMTVVQRTFLAK